MNVQDVVKATQAAERVLAERGLPAIERMEFCVAFQAALFNAELAEHAEPALWTEPVAVQS